MAVDGAVRAALVGGGVLHGESKAVLRMADDLKRQASELQLALSPPPPQAAEPGAAPRSLGDFVAHHGLGEVSQAERLLEAYLEHVCSAIEVLGALDTQLRDHEADASMYLDRKRNRLIKFEVFASSIAGASGIGSCVAGIFGMNLQSAIFDPDDGTKFAQVAASVGGFTMLVAATTFGLLVGCSCSWPCGFRRPAHRVRRASARESSDDLLLPSGAFSAREGWKKRFPASKRFPALGRMGSVAQLKLIKNPVLVEGAGVSLESN